MSKDDASYKLRFTWCTRKLNRFRFRSELKEVFFRPKFIHVFYTYFLYMFFIHVFYTCFLYIIFIHVFYTCFLYMFFIHAFYTCSIWTWSHRVKFILQHQSMRFLCHIEYYISLYFIFHCIVFEWQHIQSHFTTTIDNDERWLGLKWWSILAIFNLLPQIGYKIE